MGQHEAGSFFAREKIWGGLSSPPHPGQGVFRANLSGVQFDLHSLVADHHVAVLPEANVVVGVFFVGEPFPCPAFKRPTPILFQLEEIGGDFQAFAGCEDFSALANLHPQAQGVALFSLVGVFGAHALTSDPIGVELVGEETEPGALVVKAEAVSVCLVVGFVGGEEIGGGGGGHSVILL